MKSKFKNVWIYRRHWDGYFLSAVLLAALIGVSTWWYWASPRFLMIPLPLLVLWALIRWSWPCDGISVLTISGTPGAIPLLWWLVIWGLGIGVGGIVMLDDLLPPPQRGEPWHIRARLTCFSFLIVWFVGFLVGVYLIEHRFKKPDVSDDRLLE